MSTVRNVFFDAGGTLVEVDYRHLREMLTSTAPDSQPSDEAFERSEQVARAWFLERLDGGKSPLDGWKEYFERVYTGAGVTDSRALGLLDRLWDRNVERGLWHRPVPGAAKVLGRLRDRGLRLAVISNAEGRVADDLTTAGLAHHFETIVDSHLVGFAKPDPRIFELALGRMGATPHDSIYIGDIYRIDILGARAVGLHAVLIDRWNLHGTVDCPRVRTLEEFETLLLDGAGPAAVR